MKNSKRAVSITNPHTKIHTPQEEVRKFHEKYEIRILYFLCKYEYNISNKYLKQASETDKYKGSSQQKAYYLRRNNTTIR